MTEPLTQPLLDQLHAQADANTSAWWTTYVKDSAPFLGVKMATIRSLLHRWHRDAVAGTCDPATRRDLAFSLLAGHYTEEKLAGTLFLHEILLPAGELSCDRDSDRCAAVFDEGHLYDSLRRTRHSRF